MKRYRLAVLLGSALLLALVTEPNAAAAGSHRRCYPVDATFTSALVGPPDCTSPIGCAAGSIKDDWLLKGSMFVTVLEAAPLPPSQPPSAISVTIAATIEPRLGGTLLVRGFGVFETAQAFVTGGDFTGSYFSEANTIVGGTGRFRNASGRLYQFGWATGPATFAGEIHGSVCLP